ncbi:MAG: LPS biosynthesis protein [Bdellovibrionales bacterium RIFOXYD1_FULL_53_11]|nr:MAG: LPS biosynthesis protein [Bdellovibrionales bacterium RIFOXYD1_FULL_53_11]
MRYKYPSEVDKSKFEKHQPFEARYGLPAEIKFCKSCVISNQRPNSAVEYSHKADDKKRTIHFDADGICDACRVTTRKRNTINWLEREEQLKELCNKYRSKDGSYDCVVPGSGGKDSFYAAHMLKYKYGMHPLTCTWAPHIYTDWGWKNFQAWIHAGFDNYLHTPNGRIHRLLTRLAVENLFHPFQAFIFGQKSLAPKIATRMNIPLVFYGENEAEYGNAIADTETAKRNWQYFTAEDKSKIFLGGVALTELLEEFGLVRSDLEPYMPIDPQMAADKKIEVHYLGYYLKWHPQSCYYYSVEHGGFQASPERTPGTYSKYNSIDDKLDDFHFITYFTKFGIGRATYDAAQEIRSGDITREEGVALVKRFDGEFPERFAEEVFRYLSLPEKEYPRISKFFESPVMDRKYFMLLADQFRSPHLWQHDGGTWSLRKAVYSTA